MEKKSNLLLSISFLAFIALFALATWLVKPPEVLTEENRKVASLPKLSRKTISAFPQAFEAYFNDRFFARSLLVKARNWCRYECWQISAAPNILVGKNGWLYFLGETATILSTNEKPYTKEELEQWRLALRSRTQDLAKRGIKYVFVVAPNKQSIYPEYFPLRKNRQSRLDELSAYLQKDPEIAFVNLKDPLLSEKEKGERLYFKTDTHWNELGAFVADRYITAMLSSTFPAVQPLQLSNFTLKDQVFGAGDCTKLMGLFGWIKESAPVLNSTVKQASARFDKGNGLATEISTLQDPVLSSVHGAKVLPKAVIFHDSFGDGIKPFLGRHFSRAAYQLRQADLGVDMDLIESEKPDLVIQEVVERHVVKLVPYPLYDWRYEILDALQSRDGSQSRNAAQSGDALQIRDVKAYDEGESGRVGKAAPEKSESEWLCVLPYTDEVSSLRLTEVLRSPHSSIKATTCRQWTDAGVKVNFDEKSALYFKWYLTKNGDQGKAIKDPDSARAYDALSNFVRKSGKFEPVKTVRIFDGSGITLWKLKKKSESNS